MLSSGAAAFLASLVVLTGTRALAQKLECALKLPDFTALQVTESRGRPLPSMKVYYSAATLRLERGPGLATLYRFEEGEAYDLLARADACLKRRTSQVTAIPSPIELLFGTVAKRTASGSDVVKGHICHVEDVIVTTAQGKSIHSRVWVAQDLQGVPLKIETDSEHGPMTATFRQVVLGKPEAALLTPPAKCTPLEHIGQEAQ